MVYLFAIFHAFVYSFEIFRITVKEGRIMNGLSEFSDIIYFGKIYIGIKGEINPLYVLKIFAKSTRTISKCYCHFSKQTLRAFTKRNPWYGHKMFLFLPAWLIVLLNKV